MARISPMRARFEDHLTAEIERWLLITERAEIDVGA